MDLNVRGFTGKINDNDLRLLRIFATIVRNGSFVAAESELQIGLPSISRYVKDLEIRTGVRLCERGRRGFSLTPEGEMVFEASQRLFEDLGNFEETLRGIPASPGGVIRVGLCGTLVTPRLVMPTILNGYKRTLPNVQVNTVTRTSNLIEQDVIDGKLDLGIIFVRRRMEQLVYRPLCTEVNNIYCSIRHPLWIEKAEQVAVEDLETVDYVGYPFARSMERMGIDGILRRTAVGDNVDVIAMMVATGCYVGFLPDRYVQTLGNGGEFRPILPETFSFPVDIEVIYRQGAMSRLLQGLVENIFVSPDKIAATTG